MSKSGLDAPIAPIVIRPGKEGRLIVLLPYSPERVTKIKTVVGRRWEHKERYWTVPRSEEAIRTRHYSYRTEEAYVGWVRCFVLFHDKRPPAEMGPEIAAASYWKSTECMATDPWQVKGDYQAVHA